MAFPPKRFILFLLLLAAWAMPRRPAAAGPAEDDPFGDEGDAAADAEAFAWSHASAVEGRRIFVSLCAGCHGLRGDGRSPAAPAMFPPPRDLTAGSYRFRSTATGRLPLRSDVLRTLQRGLPGTEMPSWGAQLGRPEMMSVVLYLETLSPRFAEGPPSAREVLVDAASLRPLAVTPEILARGRKLYEKLECGKCHGPRGRGDGVAAPTLKNNDGGRSHVFDFSYGVYKGGYDPVDVYRTFVTGLNGTPMPSYASSVPDERDRWALVHYCRSLSRPRGLWFYLSERPTWRDPVAGSGR